MKVVAWAIIHEGHVYDLAQQKEDLVQMWSIEPTPLYWLNTNGYNHEPNHFNSLQGNNH